METPMTCPDCMCGWDTNEWGDGLHVCPDCGTRLQLPSMGVTLEPYEARL